MLHALGWPSHVIGIEAPLITAAKHFSMTFKSIHGSSLMTSHVSIIHKPGAHCRSRNIEFDRISIGFCHRDMFMQMGSLRALNPKIH
jgi:hypothetical protein